MSEPGIFEGISYLIGLSSDQLCFFACQIMAIIFGLFFHKYCSQKYFSTKFRHIFEIICGIFLLTICYGEQVKHLAAQAILAYLIMVFLPPYVAQYAVMILTVLYLSLTHFLRMYSVTKSLSVDISAPLMIQTQKLSSIAFNIYDGIIKKDESTTHESMRLHALCKRPKLLQLFSYILCFQNCMVGPFVFFSEYLCFIEGREEDQVLDPSQKQKIVNMKEDIRNTKNILRNQLIYTTFHAILVIYGLTRFSSNYLISDEFQRLGFFRKYFWMTLFCFFFRQKFYFAWSISSSAMLASGFGFSGLNPVTSEPEYKNAINIRFLDIELGTCTKNIFDAWNTGTVRWLRECVYLRLPRRFAVFGVFCVSAIWHGFYPAYYLCFLSAALLTQTGRLCRHHLRPLFIGSYWHHRFYDILTNFTALFCLNYLAVAFILLEAGKAMKFWGNFYFLGQLGPLLFMFLLPVALPRSDSISAAEKTIKVSYEVNIDQSTGTVWTKSEKSAGDKDN